MSPEGENYSYQSRRNHCSSVSFNLSLSSFVPACAYTLRVPWRTKYFNLKVPQVLISFPLNILLLYNRFFTTRLLSIHHPELKLGNRSRFLPPLFSLEERSFWHLLLLGHSFSLFLFFTLISTCVQHTKIAHTVGNWYLCMKHFRSLLPPTPFTFPASDSFICFITTYKINQYMYRF